MHLFETEHLTKRFGGVVALDDISFQVDKGEIVGLIGPNGSGKTTFFNVITGFLKPDSGTVKFKGENIVRLAPHRVVHKGISRTFQVVRPFRHLPTIGNVMVTMYYHSKHRLSAQPHREEEIRRVGAGLLLKSVGLADKMFVSSSNLSHGDLKRLEIARALAAKPELLLLDEPFGGLSSHEIEELSEVIRRFHSQGQTMIIIEHKLQALMKLVERVAVLNFGAKIAEGKPEEVCRDKKVIEVYMGKKAMQFAKC
jgi:branched-chain amino acid transport system ATP-binding protein